MNAIEALLLAAERGGVAIEVAGNYLLTISRPEHHDSIRYVMRKLMALEPSTRVALAELYQSDRATKRNPNQPRS